MTFTYVVDQYADLLFPDLKNLKFTTGDATKRIFDFPLFIHTTRSQAAIINDNDVLGSGEQLQNCKILPEDYKLIIDPKDLGEKKTTKAKEIATDAECKRKTLQELRDNLAEGKIPATAGTEDCACMLPKIDAALAALTSTVENLNNGKFFYFIDYDATEQKLTITEGKDKPFIEIIGINEGKASTIFGFDLIAVQKQVKNPTRVYIEPKIEPREGGGHKITFKRLTTPTITTYEFETNDANVVISEKISMSLGLEKPSKEQEVVRNNVKTYFIKNPNLQPQNPPVPGFDAKIEIPRGNIALSLTPNLYGNNPSRELVPYFTLYIKSGTKYIAEIIYRTRYFTCNEINIDRAERVENYLEIVVDEFKTKGATRVYDNTGSQVEKDAFLFRHATLVYADTIDEAGVIVREIDSQIVAIEKQLEDEIGEIVTAIQTGTGGILMVPNTAPVAPPQPEGPAAPGTEAPAHSRNR